MIKSALKIKVNRHSGTPIELNTVLFSGGELHPKLGFAPLDKGEGISVQADLTSSESIMELLLVTDALRRQYGSKTEIHLVAPYLPYGRQDRHSVATSPGEAFGLKVMCDLINAQNYASVEIWDAHSDVSPALLDRVINKPASAFLSEDRFIPNLKDKILVAPDAGAIKKVFACAKLFGIDMIRADKTRDMATGILTGTVVYSEHVGMKSFLIVDDICDGGRTFIELAKKLEPLTNGAIELYVTHGIFSQGLDPFIGVIDRIYCANVFPNVKPLRNLLTVRNA